MFNNPMVGSAIPQAFAVMMPYKAFRTNASTRVSAEVPVVVARYMCFPLAGVSTRPTVETPIGNG